MSSTIKGVSFADRPQTAPTKTTEKKKVASGTLNHVDIKKILAGNPVPTDKATKLKSTKFTTPPTARPQSPNTVPKDDE